MIVLEECKMPDILDLQRSKGKLMAHFMICQLVGAGENFPEKLSSYRANIARLMDKAIYEYSEARDYVLLEIEEPKRSVEDMVKNGRYFYFHIIANHLENCIITVNRLLRYFDKVKSGKDSTPLDRTLKRHIESLATDLTAVRNLIEHMDQDIYDGKKKIEENVMPLLNSDASEIKLLSTILKTEELATIIRKLYEFAHEFMEYKINDQGEYSKV